MTTIVDMMLAVGVICAFLLIGFGLAGLRRAGRDRLRAGLMIGAGAVTLLNIYFFATMPGYKAGEAAVSARKD